MLNYFAMLSASKLVLWCYLIWYMCILVLYFNPSPELWLNSLGLAIMVGYALFLSTGPSTWERMRQHFWESLRLFVCPFLVSSYTSLVKGKGFILLFSPLLSDNFLAAGICLLFLLATGAVKLALMSN